VTPSARQRVALLSVTPVKGLHLNHPDQIELAESGVVGDRAFFLVDSDAEMISCTELGALMAHRADYDAETGVLSIHGPDGLLRSAVAADGEQLSTDFYGLRRVEGHVVPAWSDLFSAIAGRPVRLVHGVSGAYDVHGVSLLGSASTADLAARNDAEPVDRRRFRLTIEISGASPYDEDTWDGRDLRIGDAVVRVGGPIKRCAATTRNPDTGDVDLQTLRMIGTARGRQSTTDFGAGFYFGVYADVLTPGTVRVGDDVTLVG
jgi:uncharacterized protein YcbX